MSNPTPSSKGEKKMFYGGGGKVKPSVKPFCPTCKVDLLISKFAGGNRFCPSCGYWETL